MIFRSKKNDIAKPQDISAIVSVIERVAMNKDIDVDKMERLLAMQERILDRQAKQQFAFDMAEVQNNFQEFSVMRKINKPIACIQG